MSFSSVMEGWDADRLRAAKLRAAIAADAAKRAAKTVVKPPVEALNRVFCEMRSAVVCNPDRGECGVLNSAENLQATNEIHTRKIR